MYKALLIIAVSLFLAPFVNSQNVIYHGTKQYPATEIWEFRCESYHQGNLEVQIAVTSSGGYLKLAIPVIENELFYIAGNVYVYLTDATMITCTDKGIKDNVDNKSVVLYSFSQSEMDKLKTLDIQKIRFTVQAKDGVIGGDAGNYNAENKRIVSGNPYGQPEKNYFETAKSVAGIQ